MDSLKEKYTGDIIAVLNSIFILCLIVSCLQVIQINYFEIGYIYIIALSVFYFYDSVLNRTSYKLVFIVAVFLTAIAAVYFTKGKIISYIISDLVNNYYFIDDSILSDMVISYSHLHMYFELCIPVVLYLLIALNRKIITAATFISTVLIIFSWYLIFYQHVIKCIPMYLGIVFITLGAREYKKKSREFAGRELKRSISINLVAKIVIILAVAVPIVIKIMPQEYEGVPVESVNSFFTNAFAGKGSDEMGRLYDKTYSISQSGYYDSDKKLGGSVRINNNEAFTVESDRTYYLRGRVKYEYTGEGWLDHGKDALGKMEEKVKEHSSKFKDNDGALGYNLKETKTIKITPSSKLSTNTFFSPNCAVDIIYGYSDIYADNVPLFISDTPINHPYQVEINSYGQEMDDCMQDISAFALDKQEYIDIYNMAAVYPRVIRQYGEEDVDFASDVKASINMRINLLGDESDYFAEYLSVPGTVAQGVYTLTESVLEQEAERQNVSVEQLSSIDRAIAIKNYLKNNYEYRTIVDSQKDDDFVSDFLLNSNKGYCTYFASAAVIMCRIAGVPARYVEGFSMSEANKEGGVYQVRNTNAHAWCEVLIGVNEDKWSVLDAVPGAETYDPDTTIIQQTDEPGYNRNYVNSRNNEQNQEEIPGSYDGSTAAGTGVNKYILAFAVAVSAILIIVSGYAVMMWVILRKRSIIPFYNYILRRLSAVNIIKDKSQGDCEFASSIKDDYLRNIMMVLAQAVYKEYYGGDFNNSVNRKQVHRDIEGYIRRRCNIIRYIAGKYILCFGYRGK